MLSLPHPAIWLDSQGGGARMDTKGGSRKLWLCSPAEGILLPSRSRRLTECLDSVQSSQADQPCDHRARLHGKESTLPTLLHTTQVAMHNLAFTRVAVAYHMVPWLAASRPRRTLGRHRAAMQKNKRCTLGTMPTMQAEL